MATWQLVVATILVLLPFALLTEFWPHRERLTAAGKPLDRPWRPRVKTPEPEDEHH
jgi:hypothetical protein